MSEKIDIFFYFLHYDVFMEFIQQNDEYDNIYNLRINGLLPKISIDNDAYDYTYGLTEQQILQLDMFDKKYYPEKLLSDEQNMSITENLNESEKIISSIKELLLSDNVNFIYEKIYDIGNKNFENNKTIEEKLFSSKKQIFYENLKEFFNDKIDITDLVFNSSIIDIPIEVANKIKKKIYPEYPEKYIKDMYNKFNEINKNINIAFWKTYSYELKFIDNFIKINQENLEIVNEFDKKIIHNEDQLITTTINNLKIKLQENIISNYTSEKENYKSEKENHKTEKDVEDVFNTELNKIMETFEDEQKDFIKKYLMESIGEIKLMISLKKTKKMLENILI
jgi:hypothetical protein